MELSNRCGKPTPKVDPWPEWLEIEVKEASAAPFLLLKLFELLGPLLLGLRLLLGREALADMRTSINCMNRELRTHK